MPLKPYNGMRLKLNRKRSPLHNKYAFAHKDIELKEWYVEWENGGRSLWGFDACGLDDTHISDIWIFEPNPIIMCQLAGGDTPEEAARKLGCALAEVEAAIELDLMRKI